jgi:TonB family protein
MQKSPATAALLALLLLTAAPATPSEDLRAEANALLVKAQKMAVFDPNTTKTPFHESVSFVFSGLVQGDEKGTFARDWIAKDQWRLKWELPGYQEINVRNGQQVGERESADFESVRLQQLRWALPPFIVLMGENDLVKKIEVEKVNGLRAQCIKFEAVRGRDKWTREVCLNAETDTLLRWMDERREIEWTDYTPFRETFYPRHLVVKEHGNKIIQAEVEFQDAPGLSGKTFDIPSDMRIRKACERFTSPIVTKREDPVYPKRIGVRTIRAEVVVELKVSEKGKVVAAQITETGGSDLDRAALDAVKNWEFEPAKCDGEPLERNVPVTVFFGGR